MRTVRPEDVESLSLLDIAIDAAGISATAATAAMIAQRHRGGPH